MPKDQIWANFDWQDIQDRRALEKILAKEPRQQARQAQVEIHTKQNQIIRDAKKRTKAAQKGLKNADLLREINENRAEERKREDQKSLHSAGITPSLSRSAALVLTPEEVEEDAFMVEQAQWLRKMRDGGSENAER
jgi:hypothetical protein